MKNPYSDKTNEELSAIYKDYIVSKNDEKRCESFVPYAREIKENIGGYFTLLDGIGIAKIDFFEAVCDRFLSHEKPDIREKVKEYISELDAEIKRLEDAVKGSSLNESQLYARIDAFVEVRNDLRGKLDEII